MAFLTAKSLCKNLKIGSALMKGKMKGALLSR